MADVFISYRRDDSDVAAGRLADDLAAIFKSHAIFRDIDKLEPGEDYPKALDRALDSCVALIALIGPRWSSITDEKGDRRLADPRDWVRAEIRKALKRQIRVIPILLSGTSMPPEAELPEDLKPLRDRQALELSDRLWKQELEILAQVLEKLGLRRHKPGADDQAAGADEIYRPLVDDLENFERAMSALARTVNSSTQSFVLAQLHMVEVAVAPISEARSRVSVLGDASTRKDLDGICTAVEVMKQLAEHTENGLAAVALARALEEQGLVKKLRERLLSRI